MSYAIKKIVLGLAEMLLQHLAAWTSRKWLFLRAKRGDESALNDIIASRK